MLSKLQSVQSGDRNKSPAEFIDVWLGMPARVRLSAENTYPCCSAPFFPRATLIHPTTAFHTPPHPLPRRPHSSQCMSVVLQGDTPHGLRRSSSSSSCVVPVSPPTTLAKSHPISLHSIPPPSHILAFCQSEPIALWLASMRRPVPCPGSRVALCIVVSGVSFLVCFHPTHPTSPRHRHHERI